MDTGKDSVMERKKEEVILRNMMRFNRGLHLLMGIALIITSIMVVGLFFHDVYSAFTSRTFGSGMVHALGSLLILWTLSELLDAEITYLKGGFFKVGIFIEVSIAAVIRKILILSTEGLAINEGALYLVALLILGIVHWLLARCSRSCVVKQTAEYIE
jgi:uncharacterized membrane protein (DUF373 family)